MNLSKFLNTVCVTRRPLCTYALKGLSVFKYIYIYIYNLRRLITIEDFLKEKIAAVISIHLVLHEKGGYLGDGYEYDMSYKTCDT